MAVDSLTLESSTHNHVCDETALTQQHALTTGSATHRHTSDGVVLTQTLVPADATHGHVSEATAFTHFGITAGSATHSHVADAPIFQPTTEIAGDVAAGVMDVSCTLGVDVPVIPPPAWADPQPLREVRETLPTPVIIRGIPYSP